MRTPDQILGPYFPVGSAPSVSGDLTVVHGRNGSAHGETIEVIGRILNCEEQPVCGAKLTVWQANSFGRYAHPNDANKAPLDQNFAGSAQIRSDQFGAYRFKTVKPGAYSVGRGLIRPPHIHFEVRGKFERLITQMYLAGEPLNECDRVLMSASRPEMLIAKPLCSTDCLTACVLRFDVVLTRG